MPWKRAPSCATGPLPKGGYLKFLRCCNFRLPAWDSQTRDRRCPGKLPTFAKNGKIGILDRNRMNITSIIHLRCILLLPLLLAAANAQNAPANPSGGAQPVSYASMNQLNSLLSQLEQASQATQSDLSKMRIEKWKTDSSTKQQSLANVESIKRNLQEALPEMIAKLRSSPEDLAATFKL